MAHSLSRATRVAFAIVSLLAGAALGQTNRASSPVSIIPKPRQVSTSSESFRLGSNARIVLADPRSADDRFAVDDFIQDVKETAGLTLKLGKGRARGPLVGTLDHELIRSALKRLQIEAPDNFDDEGYLIAVTANEVVVSGKSSTGVFYGLQTLKQLIRGEGGEAFIPGVRVIDWPAMRWRGLSDDISRGPVPAVDYIKRQIRTEAFFKMNLHSFYMEHTFGSESNPLIGPVGGSLMPSEIRELVAYARRYHVELVPEQQTFGHLHKALRLEKYAALAETPYGDVLSPQQPRAYQLVGELYKELNELFPGRFFHIGEDETFELGEGQSKTEAQAKGVGAVYFEHLNRIRDLLKPYNRRLMFWGDIALHHPDLIGNVPKDVIAMNWQYAALDDYSASINPFKNAGLDQFVCPGAHTWNQIFPNLDSASKNIINFVRDGQKAGAIGMLNTTWDDDGESLFEMAWHPIVLGAAASWQQGAVDIQEFDRDFDWSFFRHDGDQFVKAERALGSVDSLFGGATTDEVFWRDPFTTQFQNQTRTLADRIRRMRLTVEDVDESLTKNSGGAKRNASAISAMKFAAQRFDHLGRRMEVVQRFSDQYWDAYLNLGDRVKVRKLRYYAGAIHNNLREMAEELSILKEDYRRQWLAENRPYWLDSVLSRYDQMISIWLAKSRAMDEALRKYEVTSTLQNPEEFGLGPRPAVSPPQR